MTKTIKIHLSLVTCLAFLAVTQPIGADTIGINFNNGGATLLNDTDFVGVVPRPYWNNFRNNGGLGLDNPTPTTLIDSAGADSGATVTWDVGASAFNGNNGLDNQRMMEGWFGLNAGDAGNITVAGLTSAYTSSGYDAYVYFDSNEVAPNERTMSFTVGDTTATGTELDVNFAGTFVEASEGSVGNYVVFRGLTDSTFSLIADSDIGRAAINGIQLTTELPPGPNAPVHQYVASEPFNTAELWLDSLGGRNWTMANAKINSVDSPSTMISAAYQLTQDGPGAGGDTTPFPAGEITYEIWVRPSATNLAGDGPAPAGHQSIFETGGGQNGTAILMTQDAVRILNSQGNARTFDLSVPLADIDTSDFVQIVASLNPTDGELDLYVNGSAGGSASDSAAGVVGRGGNRASLFSWGSGLGNIGDPTDAGGGTFNLGGRTELADMTPDGLTQFVGEIGLMNVYDRAFTAAEVQAAFDAVVPEPGGLGMLIVAMLGLATRRRTR